MRDVAIYYLVHQFYGWQALSTDLDSFVDAFYHRETDVGVSIAESPGTKLFLLLVDRLAHEHVGKAFAVDELDEVERMALC